MAATRAPTLLAAVRLKATDSRNGAPPPPPGNPVPTWPLINVSRPPWIVRTESNVHRERKKKPDPPCVVCSGSGTVDCHRCCGTGRTNCVDLAILPKGVWPKWCRTCGGSGLGYCSRCQGTGKYRHMMGFRIPKKESNGAQDFEKYKVRGTPGPRTAADFLVNGEQPSSNQRPETSSEDKR